MSKDKKIDWIIHLVANGAQCEECGEVENSFLPYMCNAHTHGMERYNHLDFQMVLNYPPNEIGRILNELGLRVQAGEKFKNGDLIDDIYEDCQVRLQEFNECERKVLRVVIPDKHNHFPENDGCEEPYVFQMLDTDYLTKESLKDKN